MSKTGRFDAKLATFPVDWLGSGELEELSDK